MRVVQQALLKDFLYEAIYIPEGVEPPAREIIEQPELKIYFESFGNNRVEDCVITVNASSYTIITEHEEKHRMD